MVSKQGKMKQSLFLTGATGFLGRHLLQVLKAYDYKVRALIRPGSKKEVLVRGLVDEIVRANVWQVPQDGLKGIDTVIHLVGIIKERGMNRFHRVHVEGTKRLISCAKKEKVRKFIFMSAIGADPFAKTLYYRTKWLAEAIIKSSGLTYTILRSSIIFGKDCDFIKSFVLLTRAPIFNLFIGSGRGKLQPIYVVDVANIIVKTLDYQATENKTYLLGGPRQYIYLEFLDVISKVLTRNSKATICLPKKLALIPVFFMGSIFPWFPLTLDQLRMLDGDITCNISNLLQTFDIRLTDFEQWLNKDIGNFSRDMLV
jgi:NADH dehydrogenase